MSNFLPNAHNAQEVLHGTFDAELHKRTFIDYLEVVISPEGIVEYAIPSHSEKLLQVYMQKYSIDRETALYNLSLSGIGYIESLSGATGYISVWNEAYITGCKPTQQQLNKLKTLKLHGLYHGRIDDTYTEREELLQQWLSTDRTEEC